MRVGLAVSVTLAVCVNDGVTDSVCITDAATLGIPVTLCRFSHTSRLTKLSVFFESVAATPFTLAP